uniref:TIL domain-containing protein n=1 Tax=Panagrolaimus sp. PS1159 TaxID=55785 RepID=A0AC35FJ64_9BILA
MFFASGGSILTCNTVKCKGGHKCIMTTDECYLPFTTDPFNPTNCESRPKCVPDKICKACGPNEHRSRCSICERTCEDPNRYKCKKENICGQKSRCVCDSGHVRDKNEKCIKYENCPNVPKRPTTTTMKPKKTTTTPEEEGFIIIKRKETKQKHEQIDLLKPSTKHPNDNNEHENENENDHGKPNNPTDKPDDGFIVVNEKGQKHTKQPSKTTTEKPDDGFIVVNEKQKNHKPDRNPKPTSKPGKSTPKDIPDNHDPKDNTPDDGFIIVKEKGQKQTKRPSKTTNEKPDDGFIVVNEKQKNHNDDKPKPDSNNDNGDNEYFVSKKKVQNNKHEQINLMTE